MSEATDDKVIPLDEVPAYIEGIYQQVDDLRELVKTLAEFMWTCRRNNTPEWMERLADRMNAAAEFIGESERFEFNGDGISKKHP